MVVEAFEYVLGVDRVSVNDNFFDLGGYSLNVIRLCNELEKSAGVRLPLREIFDLVTPKNIAEQIKNSKVVNMFEEIPEIAEAESYSISSAQKRLYLLDQLTGPGTTYNIPLVIKLKVKPDNERLQRALDQLVEQEEILRTSFHIVNGEPIQKIFLQMQELCWSTVKLIQQIHSISRMNIILSSSHLTCQNHH
nr:condensation domain-containing protein [Bacillus velezensis]